MTHASLIVQGANHAAKRIADFCAFHPHHAKDLKGLVMWIKLAAQQLQRDEVFMRTKQQAVDALIELARAQKLTIASQAAQLVAAPKPEDVVTDAEVQAINELAPEPPVVVEQQP